MSHNSASPHGRRLTVAIVAGVVLAAVAGAGGATAGSLITGSQIKNGTITGDDVADNSVSGSKLTPGARAQFRSVVWRTGLGTPTVDLGQDGDWYINQLTDDAWTRVRGVWRKSLNLRGAIGAAGAAGATGATGARGADGKNGADGLNGVNGTNGADGVNGTNGTNGADGVNGTNGAAGLDGKDGAAWLSGTSAPSASRGVLGDWYLDLATGDAYTRAAQGWTKVVNLRGAPGTDGVNGLNGADGADGAKGADGADGAKGADGANGAKGADGADGVDGAAGADGKDGSTWYAGDSKPDPSQGVAGDYYLDRVTGELFAKDQQGWGAPFMDLTQPGADGTRWTTGSGAPEPKEPGARGDFYLDTTNGAVWVSDGDTWDQRYAGTSSVGPTGVLIQRSYDFDGESQYGPQITAPANPGPPSFGEPVVLTQFAVAPDQPVIRVVDSSVNLGQYVKADQAGVVRCWVALNREPVGMRQQTTVDLGAYAGAESRMQVFALGRVVLPRPTEVGDVVSLNCSASSGVDDARDEARFQVVDVSMLATPMTVMGAIKSKF